MGVITLVVEVGLVSTAASVLRRTAGIGIRDMLLSKVQNQYVVQGINMYFDVGESVCNKCVSAYTSTFDSSNTPPSNTPPSNTHSQKD
jgi:hypothetical protein